MMSVHVIGAFMAAAVWAIGVSGDSCCLDDPPQVCGRSVEFSPPTFRVNRGTFESNVFKVVVADARTSRSICSSVTHNRVRGYEPNVIRVDLRSSAWTPLNILPADNAA